MEASCLNLMFILENRVMLALVRSFCLDIQVYPKIHIFSMVLCVCSMFV